MKAYLHWKYSEPAPSAIEESPYNFTISTVDIYTLATSSLIHRGENSISPSIALAEHGYLGNAPENPSLAISLKTLELYYRLRLRKPSFSVEAFARVICDLYMVRTFTLLREAVLLIQQQIPYRRRYRIALSDAFEVYTSILHKIEEDVKDALGYNTPNWRILNACPPCGYEVGLLPFDVVQGLTFTYSLKRNQSWSFGE